MKDDSAEWMAKFNASGQLWPDPPEGKGGDGDARDLGVVIAEGNKDGQQVLGTCSPEHDHVSLTGVLAALQQVREASITFPEQEAVRRAERAVMSLPMYARCES